MRRKITPERYEHLLQMVHRNIPGVAVTTDLISGFPGETEAEFNETLEFVAAMHFAGGHVFHFSPRPGTPAASMPGQVEGRVARERSRALRGLLAKAALAHHTHFIGSILPVLWEADATKQAKGFEVTGLTANAIRVKALADEPLCNQVDMVRLTRADEKGCWGEIIKKAPA
jgi:threonylcarbamoyladenosine tRNA methylthiotransferase MtaB